MPLLDLLSHPARVCTCPMAGFVLGKAFPGGLSGGARLLASMNTTSTTRTSHHIPCDMERYNKPSAHNQYATGTTMASWTASRSGIASKVAITITPARAAQRRVIQSLHSSAGWLSDRQPPH